MNIVHYSLGFPPFRTGGMTKYCMDLMEEQAKLGHNIYMLWPGKLKKFNDDLKIQTKKDYYSKEKNIFIHSIELINPLPVPLLNGIKKFKVFTQKKKIELIYNFFKKNKIEVFHVHTLMGLPIEIIQVCNKLKIKTIFTSHDYFGICPKCVLEREGNPCIDDHNCLDCINCNKNALSLNKIKFLQSNYYRIFKNSYFFKILRKRNNKKLYIDEENKQDILNVEDQIQYQNLRKYYINMLESFDTIHFNSSNTKKVYSKYLNTEKNSAVINISHNSVKDQKQKRKINSIIRIGYLGPITKHKGYFFLKKVCDEIYKENKKFELHTFVDSNDKMPYLIKHNPYNYDELTDVMNKFDVLVVPSIQNETFGFTALESLSYGIPVVVTENVGAKDLIINGKNGFISKVEGSSLKDILSNIIYDPNIINEMNEYIVNQVQIKTMSIHSKEIINLYMTDFT